MLDYSLQQLIFNFIPTTLTIDNYTFDIQTTLGEAPLNNVQCPTVNLSLIANGTPYFRSIEQSLDHGGNANDAESGDIRTVMLRYKIAATNVRATVDQSITFKAGQLSYSLNSPVMQINSIEGFSNTNYQLSENRKSVTWIGQTPTPDTNFTIHYDCIFSSYYLATKITEYIVKDILGNSRSVLATYDIDVLEVFDIVDLSRVYETDALSVFSVDVQITYPFTWPHQTPEVTVKEIRADVILKTG